jgi:hypothetical protein
VNVRFQLLMKNAKFSEIFILDYLENILVFKIFGSFDISLSRRIEGFVWGELY